MSLAFAMPWNGTSVMFVVLSSLLLAGMESHVLLSISLIPTIFLTLWLLNYGFDVLDHAANGSTAAPTASIEVLSPFQWQSLVIMALCFLLVALGSKLGAMRGTVIISLLLVLPACIATFEVGESALQAASPLKLWRITVGMGFYYILVLVVIGLFAALAVILQAVHLWPFVRYMLLEMGVLTVFAVLGTSIFLRRIEVGFEPRSSPERAIARDFDKRQRQLDEILDEAYGQSRLKDYERAASIINRWLSSTEAVSVPDDVKVILQRVRGWGDPTAFSFIERALAARPIR
jgi:small-conductance mechanosensitive channel